MSAIFGFSGSLPEHAVQKMALSLSHRGEHMLRATTLYGSVYLLYRNYERDGGREQWIAENGNDVCVVSGVCYDRDGNECSPLFLLNAYLEKKDPFFLAPFTGDFILAVLTPDRCFLYRDGSGARSAYYTRIGKEFFFSSEPKGITSLSHFSKNLRKGSLVQYFSFSFIPAPDTFLRDLFLVPSGHFVTARKGESIELKRYFYFEHLKESENRSQSEWMAIFESRFSAAVKKRLPSHTNRIGLFLSGGIDSSMVAAALSTELNQKVKTYAIHFGKKYPNELSYAMEVAKKCRTEHHEIEVMPKHFIPGLRKMIWHLDDPIGDPITMPNFELSKRVKDEIDYVFNGEGGDPVFGGPKNIPMLLHHWYGGVDRTSHFREIAYLKSYKRAFDDLSSLLTPDYQSKALIKTELIDVLTPFFQCESPKSFLNKLMAINIRLKGANLILPKVERMTGAFGLTPLAPLFDQDLIKLSFSMPPALKLENGIEKRILKLAYKNRLPQSVIHRPKSGMRVPVHFWFKKEMRRYAKSLLSKKKYRKGRYLSIRQSQTASGLQYRKRSGTLRVEAVDDHDL